MIKVIGITFLMALATAAAAPPEWMVFVIGGINGLVIGEIVEHDSRPR